MNIRLEKSHEGRLATLTIDRPPLNILDLVTIEELDASLAELHHDSQLQLLLVRGTGERAFSAGVAVEDHTRDRVHSMIETFHKALGRLRDLPAISIAAVTGHCLGGGMELAASCDLVFASHDARFSQPEVELGCFPPWAAAHYPGRFGYGRALELLVTGRTLDAGEAEALGFVTWCVAADGMDGRLAEIIEQILGQSRAVTTLIKRAVRAGVERALPDALAESERLYLEDLTRTSDMDEGLAAFLEKRRPRWAHG